MRKIMVVDNEPDIVDLTRTVLEIGKEIVRGQGCLHECT